MTGLSECGAQLCCETDFMDTVERVVESNTSLKQVLCVGTLLEMKNWL
jgi:hypothetical protein